MQMETCLVQKYGNVYPMSLEGSFDPFEGKPRGSWNQLERIECPVRQLQLVDSTLCSRCS